MVVEKAIEVFNTLININNDRIQGYEIAGKETEEQILKTLFAQFTATSQKCKQELVTEVTKLGGKPEDAVLKSGKYFYVWVDGKAVIRLKDRQAILNSCEHGEDMVVNTYNNTLWNNKQDITSEHQILLNAQQALIKADHEKVKLCAMLL